MSSGLTSLRGIGAGIAAFAGSAIICYGLLFAAYGLASIAPRTRDAAWPGALVFFGIVGGGLGAVAILAPAIARAARAPRLVALATAFVLAGVALPFFASAVSALNDCVFGASFPLRVDVCD